MLLLLSSLILGLTLPEWGGEGPWLFLALAVPIACAFSKKKSRWLFVIATILLMLGLLRTLLFLHQEKEQALPRDWPIDPITVTAEIADLPHPGPEGTHLLLRVAEAPRPLPRLIAVMAKTGNWQAGAVGQFTVKLKPIHGPKNFYGFDLELWARSLGIGAQGSLLRVEHLSSHPVSLLGAIDRVRDQMRQSLNRTLKDHPARPILLALSVGDQSEVSDATWTVFWRTGVGHLISISGLHVTLIAHLLETLSALLWRRSVYCCRLIGARTVGRGVGLISALGYALIAGFSIPTQRTFFMLATSSTALVSGRSMSGLEVWLSALALVLCLDPLAIENPSLWLSFGAVGGLIVQDYGSFGRAEPWVQAWRAQWVVNLVLLPMIVVWFNQVSLISPVANAIAIPWVGYLVTPLTLASLVPGLQDLASPAAALMALLMQGLTFLAQPSWAALDCPTPPWPIVLLAVTATLLLISPWSWPHKHWLGLACLPLLLPGAMHPPIEHALIEIIDVGQGLAITVRTANHTLVFDTGPRRPHWDAGTRILLPLFQSEGIHRIDTLVLSHPDLDHVGGYRALRAALPIQEVLAGFKGEGLQDCERGQHWDWDGIAIEVLYPDSPGQWPTKKSHDRNNHACVLLITAGSHRVLLPADIEAEAEMRLSPSLSPVDVVIAPHHGSHTSSTPPFVEALRPHDVIVSCGYQNQFHHPDPAVVKRWTDSGARVWRTDQWGALRVELSLEGARIKKARAQEYSPAMN